ncbi:MAG: phosphatidylserine decarboxylase [Candidatus Entotheonella gemina]|uniref:Phosphatidylserine decarboxylase proenzyme n=1 Tax=Candidatus Entotheonella gemina TaxID=1429439 RepID=W4M070_9BACT|nr:MAG: phosphatidylserine decarboxylase [Candidatus Entotheonella gemina]
MNRDRLFIALQYMLPQHGLSRLVGRLANCPWPMCKTPLIRWFARHYQVNMEEAARPELEDYASFNDFFTRTLKPGARPIAATPDHLVCPADGVISQFGRIETGRIFQAKGSMYHVHELLANDVLAKSFEHGQYMTVYLSPKDYHRVHMPLDGTLTDMLYVPGRLFSVNQITAKHVPRLFARNERVVAVFDTRYGKMALVLVGAMIVASIETVWAGQVAPQSGRMQHICYSNSDMPRLHKGDEMGRFQLGSTVVMLLANPELQWQNNLANGMRVRMGQALATFSSI